MVIKSGGIVFGTAIFFYFLYQGLINPQNYNDFYRSAFIIPFLVIISAIIFFIDDLNRFIKKIEISLSNYFVFFGLSVINLPILEFYHLKLKFLYLFFFGLIFLM